MNQVSYWQQNLRTPWKRSQKSPNDAFNCTYKKNHIRPWFHWQKTNKKHLRSRHTLNTTYGNVSCRSKLPAQWESVWTGFMALYILYLKFFSGKQRFLHGITSLLFGILTFTVRIIPPFPGYVSITCPRDQCDLGIFSLCIITNFTFFEFRYHVCRWISVGRYSLRHRCQNILAAAAATCTARHFFR